MLAMTARGLQEAFFDSLKTRLSGFSPGLQFDADHSTAKQPAAFGFRAEGWTHFLRSRP
jgi:hypothetical protein